MPHNNKVLISQDENGVEYSTKIVKDLHPTPRTTPGMEFRTSCRWFQAERTQRKFRSVPYVSKSGKFSLFTLCIWNSFPHQLLFSLISTVYFRILKILRKRKYSSRRALSAAFKLAIVYTLTRSNTVIDRFLGMARKGTPIKKVENYTHYLVYALDENKRFVYSQAYFQANWLKFQVFRPRDKSSNRVETGSHLRNLGFFNVSCLCDRVNPTAFQSSSDLWQVDRISGNENSLTHCSLGSSSEFEFDLSETLHHDDFFLESESGDYSSE